MSKKEKREAQYLEEKIEDNMFQNKDEVFYANPESVPKSSCNIKEEASEDFPSLFIHVQPQSLIIDDYWRRYHHPSVKENSIS